MTEEVVWEDLIMIDKENIDSHSSEVHCIKLNSKKEVEARTQVLQEHEHAVFRENESRMNPSERNVRSVQTIRADIPSVRGNEQKRQGKFRLCSATADEIPDNIVGPEDGPEVRCAAVGLNYCEKCDRGPVCCVYLNNQSQGGGCSTSRPPDAAGGCSTSRPPDAAGGCSTSRPPDAAGGCSTSRPPDAAGGCSTSWPPDAAGGCSTSRPPDAGGGCSTSRPPDAAGGCSTSRPLDAAGASDEGEDGESDSCRRREESDDSDEASVINFYLGQSNDQEGTVVEYEFFVDDDDEADSDYSDFRYCGEDEDNDGYEDEDGDNDGENGEDLIDFEYNKHNFEDAEESCVDDAEEDEMEVEHWSKDLLGSSRSRGSVGNKFSHYQEPLEVILEILGEEDESKESTVDGTGINMCDDQKLNNEDDLMNFSSSGEYSPDSIEEYCLRKYKSSADKRHHVSSLVDCPSNPGLVQETRTLQEARTLHEARTLQEARTLHEARTLYEARTLHEKHTLQQDTTDCRMSSMLRVHTLPVDCIQQPLIVFPKTGASSERSSQPTPPGPSGKEESDRDKLWSLTSEIEAYLRETTMLLESATRYTSKAAPRGIKTSKPNPKDELDKKMLNQPLISLEVNDSRLKELQSVKSQSPNIDNVIETPGNALPSSLETSSAKPRADVINAALDLQNELSCLITSVQKQKMVKTEATRSLQPSPNAKKPIITSPEARTSKSATVISMFSQPGYKHNIEPPASTKAQVKQRETMNCHESEKNSHKPPKNSHKPPKNSHKPPTNSHESAKNSQKPTNNSRESTKNSLVTTMNSHMSPKSSHEPAKNDHKPTTDSHRVSFQSVSSITEDLTTAKEANQTPEQSEMKNGASKACTEVLQPFLETDNLTESGYSSVMQTPTEATEVLVCEQTSDETKENRATRIIYGPPEVQQNNDCYFTSENIVRREWLATFKDLEDSFDAAIKNNLPDVIKNDHPDVIKNDILSVHQHDHPGVLQIDQSNVIQNYHSGTLQNNYSSVMKNDYSCVFLNDIPDVAKNVQPGVTKDDHLVSSKYHHPGNESNQGDTVLKNDHPCVQSLSKASIRNCSPSVQSDVQKTTLGNTNTPLEAFPSGIGEKPVRRRPVSRCDSPPPTVTCLEHLEKLCNRLSLEHEQFPSEMSESEGLSWKGRIENKSRTRDEERKPTAKGEKVLELITASKAFLHGNCDRNSENNQRKSHPLMGVQHLQKNVGRIEKQQNITPNAGDRSVLHLPLSKVVCDEKSSRENGYYPYVKENEERKLVVPGETNELSTAKYINTKIDEIFSCIESDGSLSIPTNGTEILIPTKVYPHNMTLETHKIDKRKEIPLIFTTECKGKKNLQVQLNDILGDLDLMYEKHLEKYTQAYHPKPTNSPQLSTAEIERESANGPCENAAFQDIINISEDLKHLCAFHVSRPVPGRSSEHATAKGEPEGDDFVGIFNTDGAAPEAEVKNPVRDKVIPGSEDASAGTLILRPASSGQDIQRGNINLLEGVSWSRWKEDLSLPAEGKLSAAEFLAQLGEENLRCYEVTLMCLVKIIKMAQVDFDVNFRAPLAMKTDILTPTDSKNMSALQMAAEGRDYLMWCPDQEFDNAVSGLDIRGLVELVQTLQDAMAVEQQTFDSLSQQLELVYDPLQQQRLSAALCTSQTRLARLCSRNMRCFRQQALKARQKEGLESRSSSPRDSGLVMSSDAEGDPRSPTGASFKNSLAFFQRAAHLVANNAKNTRARHKEARRRSSRGSSSYGSSSSEASEDHTADLINGGLGGGDGGLSVSFEEDLMAGFEDQGTYEQVLFINGRPQYQEDLSWTCGAERNSGSSGGGGSRSVGVAAPSPEFQPLSVAHSYPAVARRSATDSLVLVAAEAQTQTQAEDVGSYVTLPRRKPYLNFKSVSSASSNPSGGSDLDNEDLRCFRERVGVSRNSGVNTITRAQSFKEGLNCYSNDYNSINGYGLSRTRSFHDGLASDFNELESVNPKLQRAPSVDEILESVKSLRAKKTMVKSTPDLLSAQEPVYPSASLPRHKSSKGKSSKAPGTSSLLGVRYNGTSSTQHYERVPEPDYEQIPESGTPYYENVCRGNNHYENIHLKGEVIYDSPKPTEHHYDKVHNDLHYENVKFDAAVYENLDEKEPTYMNVNGNGGKSNVYANLDANTTSGGSLKSSKSRLNKVTISGNSLVQGTTYDVPRAATHIYDSPQKQVRSVGSTQANEYDTPKNNRSVLPQSTQIVLKAKCEQKQKIDEIFADCDQDSLEGDRGRQPDIPSPDYGSEEEGDGYEDASNDFVTTEFPDEGLGESDTRSYYAEDPAGLEVILEEPEEEYCSSHASEDDLQREVDITYGLKGERRSLDGSEGIGSAEGDTQSTGGSELYVEEDCASSGIHSEDTPSPGPPVDSEKEDVQHRHTHHHQQEEKQKAEEDRAQQDRCVEVYPETVRQRQRNMMASSSKVDIKNWNSSGNNNNNESQMSPAKVKKFLPSVKALRNQFEAGKTNNRSETNGNVNNTGNGTLSHRSSGSTSSLASSTLEKTSSTNSLNSASDSMENLLSPSFENQRQVDPDEPVEPIFNQFKKVDEELRDLMSKPHSTTGWNPRPLLKRLYYIPEVPKIQSQGTTYINIEGFLEKLPSGRKKATFWNAWKRRYFVAKDGVLYYYQNTQAEKPSMKMTLMGGKVECMEPNMIGVDDGNRDSKASAMLGIDDGKGHYVVVRCSSRQEAERWRRALETHTVEDFASQYVQPWPMPTSPALLRDTLIIDLGSASVRAGVLASQATLPQVFLPSVVATERESRRQVWGFDALAPDVRAASSVSFPIRPSHKITKYSVDLSAISSLLQKTFADLKVDPKNYHIQLSVPRVLNTNTQTELLRVLFDKFGVRSVNLTHQSILALYAYNATSGIVVDIGERMDIVPVIDGYIVDGGVSRVPYGGYRILDHLRQFLYMRNVSLINEVESYIIRHVLENICYCAHHYNTEKARCTNNPDHFEKDVSLAEYFHTKDCPFETISLDFGRFQATEGLFNPDAWGLDHPGLHKLVHKAIMECSMDIRKEMSRSIFLAGGVTQLPGLVDRLTTEIDNLTPPAIRPKVHASPYRYHAAYIGACVLAESPAFVQSRITREDWNKHGNASLRKWSL